MDFFADLYGNDRQKAYFAARIAEGKCSHAYILEAPTGGGKKTFARRIAASLAAASNIDEKEKKCRRIMEGTSPDVMLLSREESKKTIGVDAVRDFMATVYLTPSELNFKMYIFDEADRITPQAQNALLKIIEEPPAGVYLILLCENSLSQLATVRSRAQKIALQVFTEAELVSYARQVSLDGASDAEKLGFAARMAGGTIGGLRAMLVGGETEFAAYSAAKSVIEGQVMRERGASYYTFLKKIGDFAVTREALDALTGYLLVAYGDLARARSSEVGEPRFFTNEELQKYAMLFATETVAASFAAVDAVRADMRFNVSLPLSAAVLASALWRAV